MSRTEGLLRELIAAPSVNPAFLPANDPLGGEARVSERLAALATRAGLDVQFQAVLPKRANLLVRLTPRGKVRHRILLAPHLDTVNASPAQFVPTLRHNRIYGRGACDTKGSVAAMFQALCDVAQGKQRPQETEILFAGLVDEENGQAGSRKLATTRLRADLAIVGEPTRLKVVTAHKGSMWIKIETAGKSAHGARPELGDNAVHKMARVVDALETEYASRLKKRKHPLLGTATINVGAISGGTQANIVPDHCQSLVDRRTLPGETERSALGDLKKFFKARRLEATVSNGKFAPCPPMQTRPDLPLVQAFLRAAKQLRPAGVDYFCDAAILSQGGIPSIVFGPGDIAQAHTADEWIATEQLERASQVLIRFLRALP